MGQVIRPLDSLDHDFVLKAIVLGIPPFLKKPLFSQRKNFRIDPLTARPPSLAPASRESAAQPQNLCSLRGSCEPPSDDTVTGLLSSREKYGNHGCSMLLPLLSIYSIVVLLYCSSYVILGFL